MAPCRSSAALSAISTNAAPLPDPVAAIDPADLDRFVRHLAEAAASWHRRRQAPPMPFRSDELAELARVA
jgi:hypothetical protein